MAETVQLKPSFQPIRCYRRRISSLAVCLFIYFSSCQISLAEDGRFSFGVGAFSLGGYVDVQLLYQSDTNSPWLFGLRYLSGTERFEDPFTGNPLSDDRETIYGASLFYQFRSRGSGNFYAGTAIYRQSLTVSSLVTGESNTDSVIAPYIGGGYIGRFGGHYFYNLGILISLGRSVKTQTSVTEDEKSGVDPQLIIGISF